LAQSFLLFWLRVYRAFFRKCKGRQLPLQLQEALLHAFRVPFTCAHFFLYYRGGAHRIASANCGYMACSQNLFASAAQPQPSAPMRRTSDAPREACFQATSLPRERAGDKTARGTVPTTLNGQFQGRPKNLIGKIKSHNPLTATLDLRPLLSLSHQLRTMSSPMPS